MAHSLREAQYQEASDLAGERRQWPLVIGAVAAGLGMGLLFTGETIPGVCITIGGCALWAGTWLVTRRHSKRTLAAHGDEVEGAVDVETGLPCPPHLLQLLGREIARSQRYGDRTALAVFDVRITGFTPDEAQTEPPSPAPYVAASLLESARASDIVARLDASRYVVLLSESDDAGASQFAERTRTALGTSPFARDAEGRGIYVRAWAGWVRWQPEFTTPEAYIHAATAELERTRRGYETEQSWYRGEGART